MKITNKLIRDYRLRAHYLDKKIPATNLLEAASVCGFQNTPPGSWEISMFNRVEGCTQEMLDEALLKDKVLLQAWSIRGTPVVFPTAESSVFLTSLIAKSDKEPWIYTRGITSTLKQLDMSCDDLLSRVVKVMDYLEEHTIRSKKILDRTIADLVFQELPQAKKKLWLEPSSYESAGRQTAGEAAVSLLLRVCSFMSLIVFGERIDNSPTFTSLENWLGYEPARYPEAEKELVRKFLHCYGPTTVKNFAAWLGSSAKQAKRIWKTVLDEMTMVEIKGKPHYILEKDMESLLSPEIDEERLLILGPHDPYLGMRDRSVILEDKSLHKLVWKYIANPCAVIKGGRIIGNCRLVILNDTLDFSVSLWEDIQPQEKDRLWERMNEFIEFRQLKLRDSQLEIVDLAH